MKTKSTYLRLTFLLALFACALGFNVPLNAQVVQTHQVHALVASGQATPTGRLNATQTLQLNLVLPLSNEAGLDAYLDELYDPSSANYRHFLSVSDFTQRFGPSAASYQKVILFARQNGLTVTGGSRDGMNVQVRGSVSSIEAAFHVNIRTYQSATENRTFYAPDSEPVANLDVPLWHISGLDNYANPTPHFSKRPDSSSTSSTGLAANAAIQSLATSGSGPSASYLGSDMRTAYYGGTALTGAGQNAAIIEYYGTNLADFNTYLKNTGQTNTVPVSLLSVDGTSTTCNYSAGCDDTEQILDITQILGMAPGLASLVVYTGSSDTAIMASLTSNSPLPTTIGCSWGWSPIDPTALEPYFKKMAAQGQSFFAASGDSATWSTSNQGWPADDPWVISVGGTNLVTSKANGPWASETTWSNSGGGISAANLPIPSWQLYSGVITSSNSGSTIYRNGPDVAANANWSFYVCADQKACTANAYGGTSFAAPMWAGYIALVNQALAAKGSTPIGFLNPTLYQLNLTSAYTTNFHDITSGYAGKYWASTGYDLVTGWGSPNGANLINALTGSSTATATFTLTASPTSVSVAQGGKGTVALATVVSNGFSSAVSLTATGAPTGVTASFSSASIASPGTGSSTLSLAVASTVTAGSYPITITATGGGVTKTTSATLTVTAAPSFTLTAANTSLTVVQGSKTTATLSTAVLNGFSNAISFSSTGAPTGVTVSFSPTSIAAPGTGATTATFTTTSATVAGSYSITLAATGGSVTKSQAVTLVVSAAPTFTLTPSATALTVVQASSGSLTLTTAALNSFNSAVSLSATGLPSGVTASFKPTSIAAPGSGSSALSFAVASTTVAGSYSVTLTATGGGVTKTLPLTLKITAAPSFSVASSVSTLTIAQGSKATATITTAALNGFTSAVALSATGQPTGATAVFSPASIASPGSGTSTLTLSLPSTVAIGTYTVTITGTSASASATTAAGLTKTTTIALTVTGPPSFTLTPSATSLSVVQGASTKATFAVAGVNSFNSAVSLSVTGQPTGLTASFSPASITPSATSTAGVSSTLTLAASSTLATGTYYITISAVSGSITKSITISVVVKAPPAFAFTPEKSALAVTQGSTVSATLTAISLNGFASPVGLSASGLPAGLTASFSPASMTPSATSTAGVSTTLTLTAASTLSPGTYTFNVTAAGGGVNKTSSVTVTVAAKPALALALSATSLSVKRGTTSTLTLNISNPATNALSAMVITSTSNVSFTFGTVSTPSTGVRSVPVNITPSTAAAAGTYSVILYVSDGSSAKTINFSLVVL